MPSGSKPWRTTTSWPSSPAEIPEDSEKSFVFLHQRVNHTPYTSNCAPAPEGLYIFDAETGSTDDRRRAAYDNGLRCWDRDVSALVEPFLKRPGAVHIFITADHSELMAENGSWGHGFTDLRVAMVPMMLLTNRPQSEVATLFKSWSPPTTYHLAQTVAQAFGVRLETPGIAANRFFLNNTMPFALAGFMEVEQLRAGRVSRQELRAERSAAERRDHRSARGREGQRRVRAAGGAVDTVGEHAGARPGRPAKPWCCARRGTRTTHAEIAHAAHRVRRPRRAASARPRQVGPYRPFASDPGWSEAWWWLGVPVLSALGA